MRWRVLFLLSSRENANECHSQGPVRIDEGGKAAQGVTGVKRFSMVSQIDQEGTTAAQTPRSRWLRI